MPGFTEWVAIVLCMLVGYWIVDWVLSRRSSAKTPEDPRRLDADKDHGPQGATAETTEGWPGRIDLVWIRDHWAAVLDVASGATMEEITHAYRKKIGQYHPDRIEELGPEFKALAEGKSKQINAAYDWARRLRSR